LNKDEVDKMVKEGEKFREEDKKRREEIDIRNHADSFVYQMEKTIKDAGDKVTEEDRKEADTVLGKLKELLKNNAPAADIKKEMDTASQALQKIGEKIYKATGAQGAGQPNAEQTNAEPPNAGPETQGEKKKDDVVDADYEVVDEEKKKK